MYFGSKLLGGLQTNHRNIHKSKMLIAAVLLDSFYCDPLFFTIALFYFPSQPTYTHAHSCILLHASSPQKVGIQTHPTFFTHWFIVCLNPTQSQKQGVWVRARDTELGERERAIRVGHVITIYHQSVCTVASGIIVPSLAWSLASSNSTGEK